MTSYVYNPYNLGKEYKYDVAEDKRQWNNYLQQKEFNEDLTRSIRDGVESLQNEISASTGEIVGSIEGGFTEVSGKLDDISAMLDWRLTMVEDQLRISNLISGNIALLLRIPDFQKERQYYIEQGFKHYQNARLDPDLYEDALKNLLEAEKRETSDYVVLHRIGMIYLYPFKKPELSNPSKAEEYFRRAAKYAIVESNPEAQQTLNFLAGDLSQNLDTQATTPEAAKAIAAKAYFQAGVACYDQGKFTEAVGLSGKAYSLLPSLLESGFVAAKSYVRLGYPAEAVDVLTPLIKTNRFYAVKTASDGDLKEQPKILSMLDQLRLDALHQAIGKLNMINHGILPDSQIKSYLPEIEYLISKKTYLDALKALDKITTKINWIRPKIIYDKINKVSTVAWVQSQEVFSIEDFVPIEKEDRNEAIRLQQQINSEIQAKLDAKKRAEEQQIASQRNRLEDEATKIMNVFYNEDLPRYLKVIASWAFVGWLVIGSGGCVLRTFETLKPGKPTIYGTDAYLKEGLYPIFIIVGIGIIIIAFQFFDALSKSSSIRAKKPKL